jgi:methionyl-tRNA formyltransferase
MTQVDAPPAKLVALSAKRRQEIFQGISQGVPEAHAWREKLRRFVGLHARHLGAEARMRFGGERDSHLRWMAEVLLLPCHETGRCDPASLNAALYTIDALKNEALMREALAQGEQLCTFLRSASPVAPKICAMGAPFDPSPEVWKREARNSQAVTLICPSPTSLYTLAVMELCRRYDVEVKAIVFRRMSFPRFRQEWRRDGPRLARKIWRKLVLRTDENPDATTASLKSVYRALDVQHSNVRKFAKDLGVETISVQDLSTPPAGTADWGKGAAIFTGGGLIRQPFLDCFPEGVINVHLGPLPQYKGMDVVQAPILDGCFDSVGPTAHRMVSSLDAGDIYQHYATGSDAYGSLGALRNELSALLPLMAFDTFLGTQSGRLLPIPQSEPGRQYFIIHTILEGILGSVLKDRRREGCTAEIGQIVDRAVNGIDGG